MTTERRNDTARDIAQFVTSFNLRDVPHKVRDIARLHILDGLACMLAGASEGASRLVRRHLSDRHCKQEASVIGTRLRTTAEGAALANGVQAHVLDYDDAQVATLPSRPAGQQVHPTAPVLAAALALAEAHNLSGSALIASYIAGVEVACRLGDAVHPAHYLDGFHPTGTLGVFGAAAACAHLLHLDAPKTRCALGVAGTLSSGLRAHRGTMTKALNAGNAAHGGVLAARLAQSGFTAAEDIFDNQMGFFSAAARKRFHQKLLRFDRGSFFADPGISIKLYPCPGTLHPVIDALLDLIKQHNLLPEHLDVIRITMSPAATLPLVYNRPRTGLEAKFSLPFAVAVAASERCLGMAQFTDKNIRAVPVKRLMRKVALVKSPNCRGSAVELLLKNGRRLTAHASIARGHPQARPSQQEMDNKFRQCAARVLTSAAVERFLHQFWQLESSDSVAQWLAPLRPRRVDF